MSVGVVFNFLFRFFEFPEFLDFCFLFGCFDDAFVLMDLVAVF